MTEDLITQAKYAAMYFHHMLLPRVTYPRKTTMRKTLGEGVSIAALVAVNAGAPRHDVPSATTV